jgi:hypothetical protein
MNSAKDGNNLLLGGQGDRTGNFNACALYGFNDLSCCLIDYLMIISLKSDADFLHVCHGFFLLYFTMFY